jgi:hypothetical protein
MAWVRARLCNLQKGLSPGTPASATTKTGSHDIAEILLKVALKHQRSINQSIQLSRGVVIPLTGLTPQHF